MFNGYDIVQNVSIPRKLNEGVVLKRQASRINGLGICCSSHILKGNIIYCTKNFMKLQKAVYGSVKCYDNLHVYEPTILRWINHSCKSNSRIYFDGIEITVVAMNDIIPGDEITCDYLDTEDIIPIPFICTCGYCQNRLIGDLKVASNNINN